MAEGEQGQGGATPAPEPAPRERREYVVLVDEGRALLDRAREALHDLLHAKVDDGDPQQVPLAELIEALAAAAPAWGELGHVEAFNRAGALEQVEERWPSAVESDDVRLHLIPARFWQEVTPEEAPPPPPRRKWKGV